MRVLMLVCFMAVASSACFAGTTSPGISDEEFFDILDLGRPGLEKVKSAVPAGDIAAAKHEFAKYLRSRTKPVWMTDWRTRPKPKTRPDGVDTTEADRILRRELPSVGVYHKFGREIDWTLNPINYREWPWQLNRHPFWVTLGRAYFATGEEKYAREFVYQMTDWVARCPVPSSSSGNDSQTWRTIEAGIRMGYAWPQAFHMFLTSPSFTDEAVVTMVKSFVEHARHLMRWPTSGNWLTMEANGLMHAGVMLPEFKEAAAWRKAAADRLYAELDRQVYPDGAQIELSTGYHQVSLHNFVGAWEIAHLNDIAMPADYVAKMRRMYDYNLLASMPDGTLPGLNDGHRTDIRSSMEQGLEFFPDRKDYEWVATRGKKGNVPVVGSVALAFSGQLVMRSGWKLDDLYLMMDAGPFGYGHQHEDALSLVLYSHGRYHLVDAGNYAYDSSQWRKYVLSTRAHNTVMVDGLDQQRRGKPRDQYVVSKPLPNRWASGSGLDYASAAYNEGYGPDAAIKVEHRRCVFFARPNYWIVTDFLSAPDDKPHRYESMFHLDAVGARLDEKTGAVFTENPDSSNLAIIPLRSVIPGVPSVVPNAARDPLLIARVVSGQEKPVVQGWMPAEGFEVRPIPTAIFAAEHAGPANMAYVLFPTPAGARCPVMSVDKLEVRADAGARVLGLAVRFADSRVDYFVQSVGACGKVRFLDFESDGEAVWVSMRGNEVIRAAQAGGAYLTRAGKPIAAEIVPVRDLSQTDETHRF